ncbi:NHL repeat-containing protein [Massilia yuzhufengensis]|uniref:NHL repeat-containing protein n=1 Tax=Massilia yuzhufengensis TaxID=1164594 RepID=A0A1I1IA09_9BURK|nr:NHL repeat-containing protein [Massilia yuzhufengensis]SFC31118.1 NHL repeat-containing protein [Massilia yuzhufengensis]
MNRKILIASLAGAGIALAGTALYFTDIVQRQPGALAVLTPKAAKTVPFWPARVTTVAGDGIPGVVDGPAAGSRFDDPFGVALDRHGKIFVTDAGDTNRIRSIAPDGAVATVAGSREGFVDGAGSAAAFHTPSALAFDRAGNLYVADTGNHAIRKIAPDGTVTTLAGDGTPGYADGIGRAARFNGPVGLAVDDAGILYVADTYNDRIRRIARDGSVTTLAGSDRPGMLDGAGSAAAFDTPSGIAVTTDGTLYVADTGNHAIRRIGADGTVTTIAVPPEGERRPVLRRPVALALTRDGYLYVSASGGRILQLTPEGEYRALLDADVPPSADGFGPDGTVQLYGPRGIAVEPGGSLLVADAQSHRLHRLSAPRAGEAAPLRPQPIAVQRTQPMPWPVGPQDMVHEVVGVMGEVRGSYNGDSRDHFHAGLDVRADVGARVLAVFPSKVSDPFANWGFDSLSEGISLGPLSYIHMRVGRDPRGKPLDPRFQVQLVQEGKARGKAERVRVPRGTRFAVGDPIGTINAMAHVHLDYYQGGAVVNPLSLPFVGFTDTVTPQINSIALFDSSGKRLAAKKREPLRVPRSLGEVNIVVDAHDQVNGNLARRRLGLYKLGYQLLRADGAPVAGFERPVITQVYDRLPRNPDAVKLVYAPSSGITVYGSKATHFAYAVNNRLQDGEVKAGSWQLGALAPGGYILRIYAADYAGQVALDGRDLPLVIE